jgi:hypothetical protein
MVEHLTVKGSFAGKPALKKWANSGKSKSATGGQDNPELNFLPKAGINVQRLYTHCLRPLTFIFLNSTRGAPRLVRFAHLLGVSFHLMDK